MRVKVYKSTITNRYFLNYIDDKQIESVGNPAYARIWDMDNVGRMSNYYNFKKHNNEYLMKNGYEPVILIVEELK